MAAAEPRQISLALLGRPSGADLRLGDCLDVMTTIPAQSIDLILCDPPYDTINWTKPDTWDKAIPTAELWRHYWRILKPNRPVLLFGNEPFSTLLRSSQLQHFKYDYYWRKTNVGGFANAKLKPLRRCEIVSVFSQGTTAPGRPRNMPYYPQGLTYIGKTVKASGGNRMGLQVRPNAPSEYVQEFTGYPDDFLEGFPAEKGLHRTQKPVTLLRHLIKTYSLAGETVLDNCMGSGSTGVAALHEGRKFIGIDIREDFFLVAQRRIEAEFPGSAS